MKKDKITLAAAALILMLVALFISVMSVKTAPERGAGGMISFSLGGKARLRNTIEIPLAEVDSLVLEYGSKNINVYPAEDETVTIKEYLYSDSPGAIASVSYQEDKKVVVMGGEQLSVAIFGFWMGGERIEVYLPQKSLENLSMETGSGNITSEIPCTREEGSFSLKAGSGNIKCGNASAEKLSFQAGSGNIKLESIRGNVSVLTGSGNITGESMEGNLNVKAGSGNITLKEFSGAGRMEAGSGNVKVEAVAVTGDVAVTTGSGNIHLDLPKELAFHFQAETGSGIINTSFDDRLSYNKKGNNAEGEVGSEAGGAAVEIRVKANSGNVKVSN